MGTTWSLEVTDGSQNRGNKAEAVEKTAKELPDNFDAIVKDADSKIDKKKLYDQLYDGVFLNQKKKKYWVDKKSNKNCFMLLARDLSIIWGEDTRYWAWRKEKLDQMSDAVDLAVLLDVCLLEVCGKMETNMLSPETLYQVAFKIFMTESAYGWAYPVTLKLVLPNGKTHEHKESIKYKERQKWIDIPVGEFTTSPDIVGQIEICMFEYAGGLWKSGLIIQGVVIQPKN